MILSASRKLGKYEIVRKLGRGGMADVYLARDIETDRSVALKLIEHIDDSGTRDIIDAERRGVSLQQQLSAIDSHVVRVYEFGDLEGFFFVAMEYIEGQDLAELMRNGPLAIEFATDAAIAIAETLDHAHNLRTVSEGRSYQGIVHGDIKPKNIRVDVRGNIRVLDFGIAKALSFSRRLTRNEFGSVPYASPERLDSGEVNAQSDIWSLAVMLYEMVTHMQPYQAESTERLERMIRSRIPPPPAPDPCPEPLRRILMKALANDPAVRYASARDFANELILFRTGALAESADEEFDRDATRRTTRPASAPLASDETRRTAPIPDRPAAANLPAKKLRIKLPVFSVFTRVVAILAVLCVLYGAWNVYSFFGLRGRAADLERQIKSETVTDPDQVYSKWTELAQANPNSWALYGVRKIVDRKLDDAGQATITRFRNDTQYVYEKDWQRTATILNHALQVNPDDDTARGYLRLCEGHIARFEGTRHKDSRQLNISAEKFTEAQKLMPHSPDPYLGFALLYIYGLKDVDKANAALQQAAQLGYKIGNREKAELADGYRDRGDRLYWDSHNVRGLPQEKDQISRAANDYQRALDLYQAIVPYASAGANIKRVEQSLDSVNTRLQELH